MKKILSLLAVLALLVSCKSTGGPILHSVANYVDFEKMSEKYGVFLTVSNSVSFPYETLGNISVVEYSGYEQISKVKIADDDMYKSNDDIYSSNRVKVKRGKWVYASPEDVLDQVCEEAVRRGGDGIINIKIDYFPASGVQTAGYHISGMVIKR